MSCDVGGAHSPILPSLYLRYNSFSNPSVASPTSQLILQPFRRFTYVTTHSPTLPLLYLRHNSFSNPSVASPTSHSFSNPSVALPTLQLILQPFRRFTYVITHSPTLQLLHLRHCSFSSPSFASLTSQVFTYVTWRAAHAAYEDYQVLPGIAKELELRRSRSLCYA